MARRDADATSDVDFLVDLVADAHGFAYFGLLEDLRRAFSDLIGYDVDVVDSAALETCASGYWRRRFLFEGRGVWAYG